jgi:glucans biosynthesis protein
MRRREFIASLPAAALAGGAGRAGAAQGFDQRVVENLARNLAARPYLKPANDDLPPRLAHVTYDGYRDIRFSPAHALWKNTDSPFQAQFFHRGWLYPDKVDIFEVADGRARPVAYRSDLFTFGKGGPFGAPPSLGFAGFRLHSQINSPDYFDEVAVFLGASYFRAVAKGGVYGLSARALAIGAGDPGEEFPAFRAFWIERPAPKAASIVVHGLLDSPSTAGAYRFVISPGVTTAFDVTASLFPRVPLAKAGLAPLTSMFLFGPEQPRRFDDFRPEVHDSDGLLIANHAGERLWRPLANPVPNQSSAFADRDPVGFGLIQRQRDFGAYQDLEAHYHQRPSAWVETKAGFGEGDVRLSELGAPSETEDNIVACWRPAQALMPGQPHRFSYRLNWGPEPAPAPGLARAIGWRGGASLQWGKGAHAKPGVRRFVVDFESPGVPANDLAGDVSASAGSASQVVLEPNPYTGGVRMNFELDPAGAPLSDLRAALRRKGQLCSEVWTYRWVA